LSGVSTDATMTTAPIVGIDSDDEVVKRQIAEIIDPWVWKPSFDEFEEVFGENDPIVLARGRSLEKAAKIVDFVQNLPFFL
jgi:DNA-binding Lrp family transcriptional regulator